MGLTSNADTNIVDLRNSFVGTLAPNASFVGQYVDVSDFTSITFTSIGNVPPASTGIRFEWSEDGISVDSTTIFGSDGSTESTVHSTIRSRFFRVRYTATASGQVGTRLQTLLRKGTIAGGVSKVGFVSGAPDAQIVNGIMFGKTVTGAFQPLSVIADEGTPANFNLVMEPPLNRNNTIVKIVVANITTPTQMDSLGFGAARRAMTIYNNTERGNLFLKYNGAGSLAVFDYKIPPQHVWTMPTSWVNFGGTVFGLWDFADGDARVAELV